MEKRIIKYINSFSFWVSRFFPKQALGQVLNMRLDQCIEIAIRQSPEVLKHKHAFLSSYWLYKAYQAGLKPQAVLQTTPIEYSRTFIKRYDYTQI